MRRLPAPSSCNAPSSSTATACGPRRRSAANTGYVCVLRRAARRLGLFGFAALTACSSLPASLEMPSVEIAPLQAGRCGMAPRRIAATTASPVSLCLRLRPAPATPEATPWFELDVVDASGASSFAAVVQPQRLRVDTRGIAAPITFLAKANGDYRIRVRYASSTGESVEYSPQLQVRNDTGG